MAQIVVGASSAVQRALVYNTGGHPGPRAGPLPARSQYSLWGCDCERGCGRHPDTESKVGLGATEETEDAKALMLLLVPS